MIVSYNRDTLVDGPSPPTNENDPKIREMGEGNGHINALLSGSCGALIARKFWEPALHTGLYSHARGVVLSIALCGLTRAAATGELLWPNELA